MILADITNIIYIVSITLITLIALIVLMMYFKYLFFNNDSAIDADSAIVATNTAITYNVYVHDNGDGTHDLVVSMDDTPVATASNITHPGATGTDTGIRWYSPGAGYAVTLKDALGV